MSLCLPYILLSPGQPIFISVTLSLKPKRPWKLASAFKVIYNNKFRPSLISKRLSTKLGPPIMGLFPTTNASSLRSRRLKKVPCRSKVRPIYHLNQTATETTVRLTIVAVAIPLLFSRIP